jgi:hypothetical protein
MRSSGRDDEINKYDEKDNGKDRKGVVESDEESDEVREWSSSEETDDEEFSCDEQGEETDISSEGEEGYVQSNACIHTNMIYVGVNTDDDQSDTRYAVFASMKSSLSSIPPAIAKPTIDCPPIAPEKSFSSAATLTLCPTMTVMKRTTSPSKTSLN